MFHLYLCFFGLTRGFVNSMIFTGGGTFCLVVIYQDIFGKEVGMVVDRGERCIDSLYHFYAHVFLLSYDHLLSFAALYLQ